MSTPPRLCDDARAMLEAYKEATPSPGRRRANFEAVQRRVGDARPAAAAAGLAWPIGWGLASAAAAAAVVWGLVELRSPAPQPASRPSKAASTVEPAPSQPSGPRLDAPKPAPSGKAATGPLHEHAPAPRPRSTKEEPAAQPQRSTLREETRLLRDVRASIARGALDRAARSLATYTATFPDGALREDAQAYRVIVACARGDDAAPLRAAFARRYPSSPHAVRIVAACEGSEK